MAGFLAKTYPLRDAEKDWTESEAAFFQKSLGSLAKFDPPSCSWKTFQQSLLGEGCESLQSLPPSGMTRDGVLYQLQMSEPTTAENDGGFWPTPTVGGDGNPPSILRRKGNHWIRPSGKKAQFCLDQAVQMWPTPTADPFRSRGGDRKNEMGLDRMAKTWPTPTARDDRGPASRILDLNRAVKQWPTPTVQMSRPDMNRQNRPTSGSDDLGSAMKKETGGQLNPTWVEWLMGYPCGWTVLEDWATQWFRPKRAALTKS